MGMFTANKKAQSRFTHSHSGIKHRIDIDALPEQLIGKNYCPLRIANNNGHNRRVFTLANIEAMSNRQGTKIVGVSLQLFYSLIGRL